MYALKHLVWYYFKTVYLTRQKEKHYLFIYLTPIIMKTLSDLFALILAEISMNEGKQVTYHFDIDTNYNWLSMTEKANIEGIEDKTVLSHLSFAKETELQLVYWSIFNNGRSRHNK